MKKEKKKALNKKRLSVPAIHKKMKKTALSRKIRAELAAIALYRLNKDGYL